MPHGTGSQLTYLPTILTFQYCGDGTLLENARYAVEVVVGGLKLLFKRDYSSRQHPTSELGSEIQDQNFPPISGQVELGLFLAKDIPGLLHSTMPNENGTAVKAFQMSDLILTMEPERVWDEYVSTHNTIDPAAAGQGVVKKDVAVPVSKKASDWLPPRWKIETSLSEGGQGWTYKVRRKDGPDRNSYVLKRLKNKDRLTRFKNEIAALTKLQHPGILKILETSDESEVPFFVAEYCEGNDLGRANLVGKGLLPKLRLFRQVCDAVSAAHNARILHRDLKPQNIFIRKDDSIVVGDWGLCIDLNDAKERATQTLEAVGAERYIAPEVAKGRVAEPQATSDLYSLGKVLYFILSGRTLVREEYAEGEDDLRKRDAEPGVHFVYELFDKTIRERPEDRFQSAADLLYELDTVIERVQLGAHILKPSSRQHCIYCVVGEYRRASGVAGNDLMFVCSNCGNVQRFTGDSSRVWWEKT